MTSGANVPGTIPLSTKEDVAAQAVASLAKQDPSRYWYRRVAIAARDLRAVAAAVGRTSAAAGDPAGGTAWVVAPGLLVTSELEPAVGSTVRFASDLEARVRRVRRSEREPRLAIVEVDGTLPPRLPLARETAPNPDVAVVGWGHELFLALGVLASTSGGPRFDPAGSIPLGGRGAPVLSLSSGEIAGLVDGAGAVIPAECVLAALALLGITAPTIPARSGPEDDSGLERKVDPSEYDDREGYDEGFIGRSVPLPKPKGPLRKDVLDFTSTSDETETILRYTHFSVVMSRSRHLSMFTGVNIAGRKLQDLNRSGEIWRLDPRIPDDAQFDNSLYVDNDLDRGHMVRRLDPVWGDEAEVANSDTFHYTNSCPQHKDLNQKIWNDLEEYIYENTGKEKLKVNVFTGPVLDDDDPPYRGAKIPLQFWKVVTMLRPDDGRLSATAYILSQADMIDGLEFVFGQYRTYQLPIAKLEEMTHLDFGELRQHDPMRDTDEGLESAKPAFRPITRPADLIL